MHACVFVWVLSLSLRFLSWFLPSPSPSLVCNDFSRGKKDREWEGARGSGERERERERESEFGVYVQGRYILGGNILMVGLENDLQMLSSTM